MSSEHERPDDRELDEFFSGRSPLSSAYREASRESAPPALDAPILAAAKAAAQQRAPRRPAWLRPLAFAATFVLSLSMLLTVWREPTLRKQVVPGEDLERAPRVSEAEVGAEPAPAKAANELQDALGDRKADEALAKEKREMSARERSQVAPPQEESRFKLHRQLEEGEVIGHTDDRAASGASVPSQPRSEAPRAATAIAPEPPKPEPPAWGATGGFAPEPPPAVAPAAPPPPPAPVELDAPLSSPGLPAASPASPASRDAYGPAIQGGAPARPDTAAQKKAAPMADSSAPASAREDATEDLRRAPNRDEMRIAGEWATRIRTLWDRGDLEGARRELEALRKAYPAFEVPPDLRRLDAEPR